MRLLLILPTSSYSTAAFMEAAGRLDVDVDIASDRRQALADLAPGRTVVVDIEDPVKGVEQIVEAAAAEPYVAIVGTDDATAVLAAMASAALGLRHNPPQAVTAAGNKHLMRGMLSRSPVPSPDHLLASVDEHPERLALDVTYPCVIKPTFLAASRGVARADNPVEFALEFRRLVRLLAESAVVRRGREHARHVLIEDYIPGTEAALEGLLVDGQLRTLAIFDKPDPLTGPHFAETIYLTPSRLEPAVQAAMEEQTAAAAHALGLREGPLHAELRWHAGQAWVIEVAARQIGGLCSRMLQFGAGMSLEELILRHVTSMPVSSFEHRGDATGVMMLPVPVAGTLRAVAGIDAALLVDSVTEVLVSIPIGQQVRPLPEGDRYLGFVFANAPSPDLVEAALRRAHRQLSIEID